MKKLVLLAALPFALAACGNSLPEGVTQVYCNKGDENTASVGVVYKDTPIQAPGCIGISGNCVTYSCTLPISSIEQTYTQNIDVTTATKTYHHQIKINYIAPDVNNLTINQCTVVAR